MMKPLYWVTCILAIAIIFSPLRVEAATKKKTVGKKTQQKTSDRPSSLTAVIPGGKIGVAIYSLSDGKKIFGHHDQEPLNPASCQKILTAVAALKTLGPDYRFKTIYSTNTMQGHATGNLYVSGGGDPSLVQERLLVLGQNLYEAGLREVKGDIVIDNSFFDGMTVDGKLADSAQPYTALVSALAVNFNSFKVVSSGVGGSASVQVDPPLDYFILNASVKPGRGGFYVNRSLKDGHEVVIAKGRVSGQSEQYATVSDPVAYGGYAIKWALEEAGIKVRGQIREGETPDGAITLFTDESKPLTEVLSDMNKFSNNFIAEMTLKTLGAAVSGRPASTSKGAVVVRRYLAELDVNESEYEIVNGSGLSRDNRISANTLLQVLVDAWQSPQIRDEFVSTFPIGGVDGTLKSRFKSPDMRGNVRAKTGTLSGVSSLAGYMRTRHGNDIAFSILLNGAITGGGSYHGVQENVLKLVYEMY